MDESFYSGSAMAEAAAEMLDLYQRLKQTAADREEEINRTLAEAVRETHGSDIEYFLNDDENLELSNGLVYKDKED